VIELPFPPASLSGHAKGNWHGKSGPTAKARTGARKATEAAGVIAPPGKGDIRIIIAFYPPNRRGDRVNFPIRVKPVIDGIADALGVNDSRFLPSYIFGEPVKGGKVVVEIGV
jgi:hypothetical protein